MDSDAAYDRLRRGAPFCACGGYLAGLDALHRSEIFNTLAYERLRRKYETVRKVYLDSGENWNQAFYVMLFRYMGDTANRETYMELARRVRYKFILRERGGHDSARIEALLFGGAGLLDALPADDYIRRLEREFDYLSRKYDIQPLGPGCWQTRDIRPANKPTVRLAQLAAFLGQQEFVIEQVLECRNGADAYRLFGVEAPQYWSSRYRADDPASDRPRRVGHFKTDIIAINLVAILQFAYGTYAAREPLLDRAVALLESIPAEENRYIRRWREYGLHPANAFESQALLELATEYCAAAQCEQCPAGRRIVGQLSDAREPYLEGYS